MGQKKQLGLSLSRKKGFFRPKIGGKFENKVQKLTNFQEKKGFFGPKKQAGAELNLKMRSRNLPILKKKRAFLAKKNKLELSLITKKGFFGPTVGGKREYKGKTLTNYKKRDFLGQKNKLGLSLRRSFNPKGIPKKG